MICADIIFLLDTETPNKFTAAEKIGWLTLCDNILHLIMAKYENAPAYSGHSSVEDTLLCEDADLYTHFCEAKIAYLQGEIARYNNAISMFESRLSVFRNGYNSSNTATTTNIKYF